MKYCKWKNKNLLQEVKGGGGHRCHVPALYCKQDLKLLFYITRKAKVQNIFTLYLSGITCILSVWSKFARQYYSTILLSSYCKQIFLNSITCILIILNVIQSSFNNKRKFLLWIWNYLFLNRVFLFPQIYIKSYYCNKLNQQYRFIFFN